MTRKMPEVVECANCERRLDPKEYWIRLNENAPEARVHRVTAPTYPPFTVLCTCGHYTVFTPTEQ